MQGGHLSEVASPEETIQVCQTQHLVTESPINKIRVALSLSTNVLCCSASGVLVYGQRYSGISEDRSAVLMCAEADTRGSQVAHRSVQKSAHTDAVHNAERVPRREFSILGSTRATADNR